MYYTPECKKYAGRLHSGVEPQATLNRPGKTGLSAVVNSCAPWRLERFAKTEEVGSYVMPLL